MGKRIVVVAPHADDEILGCGGTMVKLVKQGNEVSVIIMTNANKSDPEKYTLDKLSKIRKAAVEANKLIGVKDVFFEDFPAPALDQFPTHKIADSLHKLFAEKKFDVIYVPHRGDIHNDHKVIFDAALVAANTNASKMRNVKIRYAALNFRDVMLAYNKIDRDCLVGHSKHGDGWGLEFSGFDVTTKKQKKVIGLSCNSIGTAVTVGNHLLWELEEGIERLPKRGTQTPMCGRLLLQ